MSIQSEITRIQTARNTLRSKAVELGIAKNTAKLDELAAAFGSIGTKEEWVFTMANGSTVTKEVYTNA